MKSLLEYGLLKPGARFFDYGWGQGADIRGLQALGHVADGWDPVHRADSAKGPAEVVNLGGIERRRGKDRIMTGQNQGGLQVAGWRSGAGGAVWHELCRQDGGDPDSHLPTTSHAKLKLAAGMRSKAAATTNAIWSRIHDSRPDPFTA